MRMMNRLEQPFRGVTTLQEQINRVFGDLVGRTGEESNLTPWQEVGIWCTPSRISASFLEDDYRPGIVNS